MFFKIGIIKNFANFNRKTPVLGSLFNKVAGLKVCNIDSNTGVFCGYCKIFRNSFLTQQLRWLLLTVLPRYNKLSWDACSLISHLHVPSILIKNFHETLHVIKQFLPCLNWLVTFWKNIFCFRFWWKTYTKCCASINVISRVTRLSWLALCGWPGAFNFRIWFGKRKNAL